MTTTRVDILCGGRLALEQPTDGYRFGIDALLLASVAATLPGTSVLDACAGCGVVGLATAQLNPLIGDLTLVELQAPLQDCALRNLERYGSGLGRSQVLAGDLRSLVLPDADIVTMNPPFYRVGAGRVSPNPALAAARHQLNGTLPELVNALNPCIPVHGHLAVVIDAAQQSILDRACDCYGLRAWRRILIAAAPYRREHLAIVVYRRQRVAATAVTRAFLCDSDGHPDQAVQSLTQGQWDAPLPGPLWVG
jgi:tRNA1(Val) A37 N6-methylase TrmN6